MSRRALVFGATGQIGRALLPGLDAAGWAIDAVSRSSDPASIDAAGIRWHRADLFASPIVLPRADVIFSLGPLDGFVQWLAQQRALAARIVAFGSTSADTKRQSADAEERRLADSLCRSEAALAQHASQAGARWTLLRPTLIYGSGGDRNLSRIVALARRARCFVLPRDACGLRQPVHVDDLALAAMQVVDCENALDRSFDLPGGESLRYDEMVRRVLACLDPPLPLFALPRSLFALLALILRTTGRLKGAGTGVLERMSRDLVFDLDPARQAFGFAPREFRPNAAMFDSKSTPNMLQRSTN